MDTIFTNNGLMSVGRIICCMCFFMLVGTGCVEGLSLDQRPCKGNACVTGWRCCQGMCVPEQEICPTDGDCSPACAEGQLCFSDKACYPCDRNKFCGPECINCTKDGKEGVCRPDGSGCYCRDKADCPLGMLCSSTKGKCYFDTQMDGGSGDGGVDGIAVYPTVNNTQCGYTFQDCTQQTDNWACLDSMECGCRENADCLPNQRCHEGHCLTSDSQDGGFE